MNNNAKAILWLLAKKLFQLVAILVGLFVIVSLKVILSKEYRIKEHYEVAWATRYSKTLPSKPECGNCISVDDTAREGFYYDTEEAAKKGAHQSMVNDTLEGYKVYFNTLEVYPTLKPK
jgi:hypothetical protein